MTCPVRDSGFCGALLGTHASESRLSAQPFWQDFRQIRANENIVTRAELTECVYVLCDGWAFRYNQLSNGRRQILNILLAGDLFSAVTIFEDKLHFAVRALTEVRVSLFKRAEIKARLAVNPAISAALTRSCIAQSNDVDELLAVVGQGSAEERIAYLFLHLMKRIATRSVIREQRYRFPLRQHHIAETVGLTPVHVSRVVGLFRVRGLIDMSGGFLTVLNLTELERIGLLK
jgi:CRP-like cAMP-binding protein